MLPAPDEYAPYYTRYISLVTERDIVDALEKQIDDLRSFADRIPDHKEGFAYAEGKWAVREVIGHIIDCERVFGYRAFCFSRRERASLPGFDQGEYVARSRYAEIPLAELIDEFIHVRASNLIVLRRLKVSEWDLDGTADDNRTTVRALAYIMAGHVRYHLDVLRAKYGLIAHPVRDNESRA